MTMGDSDRDILSLQLPNAFNAAFFAVSVVVYAIAIRVIYVSSSRYKRSASCAVGALLATGAFIFFFDIVAQNQLCTQLPAGATAQDSIDSISAGFSLRNKIFLLNALAGIITGWVVSVLLVLRAYVLLDRDRWVLTRFGGVLVGMMALQTFFLQGSSDYARPLYPNLNILLCLCIEGLMFKRAKQVKPDDDGSVLGLISAAAVENGRVLVVAFVAAQVTLAFTDLEPIQTFSFLPHLQNIVSSAIIASVTVHYLDDHSEEGYVFTALESPKEDESNTPAIQ